MPDSSAMVATGGHVGGFMKTTRTDSWWKGPGITAAVLLLFVVYSTWAGFQGENYWYDGTDGHASADHGFGGYLSPMYSPVVFSNAELIKDDGTKYHGTAPMSHALLGAWPSWWPAFLVASPAFLILIFPGAFRVTCYYYRKAYYRAFFATPLACGVNPIKQAKYRGETRLLLFQNLHRYALYAAIIFLFILSYDAFMSYFRNGEFGVGVGSLILTLNVVLLSSYTLGCHSWRHLVGGRQDCFSCSGAARIQHHAWKKVSWLNKRHMNFAWASLIWVGFSDFYIRMVASGVITDLNTWGTMATGH